jgi:hypothetical protein
LYQQRNKGALLKWNEFIHKPFYEPKHGLKYIKVKYIIYKLINLQTYFYSHSAVWILVIN